MSTNRPLGTTDESQDESHARIDPHEPEARSYGGDLEVVCLNPQCTWVSEDGPFWGHWTEDAGA